MLIGVNQKKETRLSEQETEKWHAKIGEKTHNVNS